MTSVIERSGVTVRAASLLLFALAPAAAKPPAKVPEKTPEPFVTIRIINAKTGQPVIDEKLNVALRSDQIGSVAMATDKKGLIEVKTGNATIIRILSNMYADCRPRQELYTDYPLIAVRNTGITTGNLCSDLRHRPTPGELVLYEIPRTFIPAGPIQH